MWAEVDSYVLKRYGVAATEVIEYHYTDWSLDHQPYTNASQMFMSKTDRGQVRHNNGCPK